VHGRSNRSGRHRDGRDSPAAALGLSITALLSAYAAGVAFLPASFTGPGVSAETPAAAIAALAPGTSGGAPGARASQPAPSPSPTPSPAAKVKVQPAKKPVSKVTTTKVATGSGLPGQEDEVVRLVNVERRKAGCGTVALNTELRAAIRKHVQELATHGGLYISHVGDNGSSFVQRAEAQGYHDAGGENVARGQRNAADVMDSWMNSEGHRANILNCSFKAIGAGAARGVDGTIVWGQIFGRK
jgi:uncharacterized protein YkwD